MDPTLQDLLSQVGSTRSTNSIDAVPWCLQRDLFFIWNGDDCELTCFRVNSVQSSDDLDHVNAVMVCVLNTGLALVLALVW